MGEHGLRLNLDKCVVQTTVERTRPRHVQVDSTQIPIVSSTEGFKILGTIFTLQNRTDAELDHRIEKAWGQFHKMWPLLGRRSSSLWSRFRLFDCTVSQSLLWCSESWLITQAQRRRLQSIQNHMLRKIVGTRRGPHETWLDWVIRSTHRARELAEQNG
eukprot:1228345-Karenia_brevis.AAC.1